MMRNSRPKLWKRFLNLLNISALIWRAPPVPSRLTPTGGKKMTRNKLCLAAFMVALIAMALLGTSSASATALCEKEPDVGTNLCRHAYPSKTSFKGSAESASFETPLGTLSCAEAPLILESSEAATPKGQDLNA